MTGILSIRLTNTRADWPGNSDYQIIIERTIKQTRFYLDFKGFTYHNFFHKINQNNDKKERAGEGMVGGKKVQEVHQARTWCLRLGGNLEKRAVIFYSRAAFSLLKK